MNNNIIAKEKKTNGKLVRNKLFIHEHPPGSGKTYKMVNTVHHTEESYVYACPTLHLIEEILLTYPEKTKDWVVITSESVGEMRVFEYIRKNLEDIQKARVILTTHKTLLMNLDAFKNRHIVFDELPTEVISFESIPIYSDTVANLVHDALNDDDLAKEYLSNKREDAKDFSNDVYDLFSASTHNDFLCEHTTNKTTGAHWFHYTYCVDPTLFNEFESIHILGATVQGTLPFYYFTDPSYCGYMAGVVNINGRDNDVRIKDKGFVKSMTVKNSVTIYPLTKYNKTSTTFGDFLVKKHLESHYDQMVNVIKSRTSLESIAVTNLDYKKRLKRNQPIEVIDTKCHGSNKYDTHVYAAVMYCANPTPEQIKFMKKFAVTIGKDEDFFIEAFRVQNFLDVVYQTVTRTAVRVRDNRKDCAFFVPDMASAQWLKKKMKSYTGNVKVDKSLAIKIDVDNGGARTGNTNATGNKSKLGKGCPVTKLLVENNCTPNKAARLIKRFTEENGFKPSELDPKHLLVLKQASDLNRVPKTFSFKVS